MQEKWEYIKRYNIWITAILKGDKTENEVKYSRLYFWKKLKRKLGQVLNLGLVSCTSIQITPIWACGFLFSRYISAGNEPFKWRIVTLEAGVL